MVSFGPVRAQCENRAVIDPGLVRASHNPIYIYLRIRNRTNSYGINRAGTNPNELVRPCLLDLRDVLVVGL
jgi:hypothetical protein